MKCYVGLGNPGDQYSNTKHNFGYWVVDSFLKENDLQLKLGKGDFVFAKSDDFILESFNARVCKVKTKAEKATRRPKVLGIEWLDPPFIGGHWVPEIIEMSGGTNLLGSGNTPSRQIKWDEASKSEAEIAILMVCGFDLDKTVQQFNKTKSIEFWDKFNGSITR